jgi:hypothetical protein
MPRFLRINKRTALAAATALLVVCGSVGWLEREPLTCWFYLRGLARADEGSRAVWVERVTRLDNAATPGLLAMLAQNDVQACGNAEAALIAVSERWGEDDARRIALAKKLADDFARFSGPGRAAAVNVQTRWLSAETTPTAASIGAAAKMLETAAQSSDSQLRAAALQLTEALAAHAPANTAFSSCRQLVAACFEDSAPENRVQAIAVAERLLPDMQKQALPLLSDPEPAVRVAAMRAIGATQGIIETEDLLRWLHDSDPDVRRMCERALRGRNLTDRQIGLGRLITDPAPRVRLQVLTCLRMDDETDVYAGVWLRHLSHDPAPEVRIGAIRAIRDEGLTELNDRIDQMARNDPSPTVCDFARRCLASQGR